jgi:cellulose synthase/poly-beta-1,6-N-acetylglucosamine synthase-like glycosyltransferase
LSPLEWVFWAIVALVAYAYVLFPLLVLARGRLWRRPYQTADWTPSVSLIVAAYNEEAFIRAKLENILALDYPRDRLEVLIASDGSNDATNSIVTEYADRGIRLLALPRRGKAATLNSTVATALGEVLVFSDANSMYAPDAIRALVRPLVDPQVGGVAGNQVYLREGHVSLATAGERTHWDLDCALKIAGSRSGNAISATGAIYAIRRSLFLTVPEGVTDDFITSTRIITQGHRLVFAPDAIAYEPVAKSAGVEFGRKVRVITRGLRGVVLVRELLNPFRYGFYSLHLFSQKILRRLVVFPLLALLVVSALLWPQGIVYQAATVVQLALYGCAGLAVLLRGTPLARLPIFTVPFYFCLVNTASFLAAVNVLRRNRIVLWEPRRAEATLSTSAGSVAIASVITTREQPLAQKP